MTLALLAVLISGAVWAAAGLKIDSDSSRMLSPDLPAQRNAHRLKHSFPQLSSNVIVLIRSRHADAADLVTHQMAQHLAGSAAVARVFAPSADPFMAAHGFLYRDLDTVEEMFTRLSKSSNLLAHLRADQTLNGFVAALVETLLLIEQSDNDVDVLQSLFAETASVLEAEVNGRSRPFAWSAVLADQSIQRSYRMISIQPVLDRSRANAAKPALQAIAAAAAAIDPVLSDQVEISVTGEPALRADELQSVTSTIGISLGLSLVLVALLLIAGLRSARRAGLAVAVLIVSLILATGFAGLAVGSLNLISIAFIVLMVGLGIDFAIHVIAHIEEMRGHGTLPEEAVALTGLRVGPPLALSAMTTALAFLAFTQTDFIGMAQLGIIGAGGMAAAFLTSLVLIPAAYGLGLFAKVLAAAPGRRRGSIPSLPLAAIALAVSVAAIWPAGSARFNADPLGLRNPDAESVRAFQDLAAEARVSPYRASILVESLEEATTLAAAAAKLPGVAAAITLSDLLPEDQDEKIDLLDFAAPSIEHAIAAQPTLLTGDLSGEDRSLTTLWQKLEPYDGMAQRLRRAITAYAAVRDAERDAALQEMIFQTFGLLTDRMGALLDADFISLETLPAPLRERFLSADGSYRVEIQPDRPLTGSEDAEEFAATIAAFASEATGAPLQQAAARQTIELAMLKAIAIAALATAVLTFIATLRVSITLAVLVPLAAASSVTIAFSALAGFPFNYANVIVLPLMIGMGVDSAIHMAFREERAPGAVFSTSTPRAVILSVATTIAAFGTLALSDHRGTASMGVLLCVALLAASAMIFALTPQILRVLRRRDT